MFIEIRASFVDETPTETLLYCEHTSIDLKRVEIDQFKCFRRACTKCYKLVTSTSKDHKTNLRSVQEEIKEDTRKKQLERNDYAEISLKWTCKL